MFCVSWEVAADIEGANHGTESDVVLYSRIKNFQKKMLSKVKSMMSANVK